MIIDVHGHVSAPDGPYAYINGWIDEGRLVPLAPADGDNGFYEVW